MTNLSTKSRLEYWLHFRHTVRTMIDTKKYWAPAINTEINSYCSQLNHTKTTLIFIKKILKTLDVKMKTAKLS